MTKAGPIAIIASFDVSVSHIQAASISVKWANSSSTAALPYVCRSLQFDLVVEAGSIGWQKTPNAEMLLSPSKLPFDKIGPCRCASYASDIPRLHGHVITRTWGVLPCCSELARLAVNSSFQCRTYPPLERICEVFGNRLFRFLKTAGFADDHLDSRSALFLIQHVAC